MRLFTAIELPEAVRAAVHAAASPILRGLPGCRPVAAENLHVTVRFLGEVGPERLDEIATALRSAASTAPAARLRIAGFGAFPDLRRPRVVWAGVEDDARSLPTLERAVSDALEPMGFPHEDRAWTAHVTVARLGDPRRRRSGQSSGRDSALPRREGPHERGVLDSSVRAGPDVSSALAVPAPAPAGPPFDPTHLTLFASELGPGGPRYRVVDRFALRDSGLPRRERPHERKPPGSSVRPGPASSGRDSGLPRRERPHEREVPDSSVRPGPDEDRPPPPG